MTTKRAVIILLSILTTLFISAITCSCDTPDIKYMGESVSKDVGVLRNVKSSNEPIIFVLEENHSIIRNQIEHAIVLVRLHNRYNMKNIALEGYLKERPPLSVGWFTDISRGLTDISKAKIAVSLLKDGEINNAEFIALVYGDVVIHPVEVRSEYEATLDIKVLEPLQGYFEKIAATSEDNKTWIINKLTILNDTKAIRTRPVEQNLALLQEIKKKGDDLSLSFTSAETKAMQSYITFLERRAAASTTLFKSTMNIAKLTSPVALIIGSAHTEKITKMLESAGNSYVTITPTSLKIADESSNLPWEKYERKYKRLSVFSTGYLAETIEKTFPVTTFKKPEPVINENWLKAKTAMYVFTTKIVEGLSAGGKPPFKLTKEDLTLPGILSVDPNRIGIVEKPIKAAIFPVTLYRKDGSVSKEMWVKAARSSTDESGDIELMLKNALKEIDPKQIQNKSVENEGGKVQITRDIAAVFSPTQAAAESSVM